MCGLGARASVSWRGAAEEKLTFARDLGATTTLNANDVTDVVEAIWDLTGGGAHLSLDALGSATTCFNSVACLRRQGRHVQVGLLLASERHTAIPMDRVIGHELEIRGSHGMAAHRYGAMLELIAAGRLWPDRLVTRTISLAHVPDQLPAMAAFPSIGVTVMNRMD